jgi:hypothetical protein
MTHDTFPHLAARAKAAGYTLSVSDAAYSTSSGQHLAARCYFASRWGHERRFDSLEEVARWLDTVTGRNTTKGDQPRSERGREAMDAAACESAAERGTNGAPALATLPQYASPGGGPMGAGQAAAAAPTWRAYEHAKSEFSLRNPGATADEIEEAAKRAARRVGV